MSLFSDHIVIDTLFQVFKTGSETKEVSSSESLDFNFRLFKIDLRVVRTDAIVLSEINSSIAYDELMRMMTRYSA
jgi:hypothetical protein